VSGTGRAIVHDPASWKNHLNRDKPDHDSSDEAVTMRDCKPGGDHIMNPSRRILLQCIAGGIAGLVTGYPVLAREPQADVYTKSTGGRTNPKALNPQPEVPSKGNPAGGRDPKALNPQPEVPSKGEPGGWHDPKALNPQPEVPSKPKKKKKLRRKKAPVPPNQP
jgi:hypothetical protein